MSKKKQGPIIWEENVTDYGPYWTAEFYGYVAEVQGSKNIWMFEVVTLDSLIEHSAEQEPPLFAEFHADSTLFLIQMHAEAALRKASKKDATTPVPQ